MKKTLTPNFLKIFILFICINHPNINGSDLIISFAGNGATTQVESVIVQNLTSGESITILSGNTLTLTNPTALNQINASKQISISPNPMNSFAEVNFIANKTGITNISVYNLDGKEIISLNEFLLEGDNSFLISIKKGVYIIKIQGNGFSYSDKIISKSYSTINPNITFTTRNSVTSSKIQKSKSSSCSMQYNFGEQLLFKAISGSYSTIITDIPSTNKTITFDFIPCSDADGNNYSTVKIGNQIWMADNLRTTKYRNGEYIGTTNPATADYTNEISPKYQWAYQGDENSANAVGRLYTWYTITDNRNICPQGWHVASNDEWLELINTLGGESQAGKKMKAIGTSYWKTPNTADNSSGFSMLPIGLHGMYGDFYNGDAYHMISYVWTSSENQSTTAWSWALSNNSEAIIKNNLGYKTEGQVVRCVRDALVQ